MVGLAGPGSGLGKTRTLERKIDADVELWASTEVGSRSQSSFLNHMNLFSLAFSVFNRGLDQNHHLFAAYIQYTLLAFSSKATVICLVRVTLPPPVVRLSTISLPAAASSLVAKLMH